MSSLNKNEKKKNPDNIIIKNLLKYNKTKEEQSQNIIKKLIFHKKSHFTSTFIEYLIWDDFQEFFDKYYSYKYIPKKFNKIEFPKNFYPVLVDSTIHKIIYQNKIMKKMLNEYLYNEIIESKKNNFINNILPLDISGEKKIFGKNINNDISISLDLKLNKKYDMKILKINTAFIKGKNGENDKEIIKVIKLLKPIKKENKINYQRKTINKIKKIYYNSKSTNRTDKKDNNRKIIKKFEINNNINRIKCNSLNSHKKINNNNLINSKYLFKIDAKKHNTKLFGHINKSKEKSRNINNNNKISSIDKINNNSKNIKTISNIKINKISSPNQKKIFNLIKSSNISFVDNKNKQSSYIIKNEKIKKILIDKKITNSINKNKYISHISPSPEIKKKNQKKLYIEKIIKPKKERSYDNKKNFVKNSANSPNKFISNLAKKIL